MCWLNIVYSNSHIEMQPHNYITFLSMSSFIYHMNMYFEEAFFLSVHFAIDVCVVCMCHFSMCMCMCVYMCVCSVCRSVCICSICVCMCLCVCLCVCVCVHVCVCLCVCVCVCVCVYIMQEAQIFQILMSYVLYNVFYFSDTFVQRILFFRHFVYC